MSFLLDFTLERISHVTLERIVPYETAIKRLREAPLDGTGDEKLFIYRDARIAPASFYPDDLNLTSLYVLKSRLEFQRALRIHLLARYRIDTLKLPGVIHLRTDEGLTGMAPPYVELYQERVTVLHGEGDRTPPQERVLNLWVLKDGIHRAQLAREEGVQLRCFSVAGAFPAVLPYAYPNAWSEVTICDEIPPVKKYHRRVDHHTFMRPIGVLRQTGDTAPSPEYGREK